MFPVTAMLAAMIAIQAPIVTAPALNPAERVADRPDGVTMNDPTVNYEARPDPPAAVIRIEAGTDGSRSVELAVGAAGPNCPEPTRVPEAELLADGRVRVLLSPGQQVQRLGRQKDMYAPGDAGYDLARALTPENRLCGGNGIAIGYTTRD